MLNCRRFGDSQMPLLKGTQGLFEVSLSAQSWLSLKKGDSGSPGEQEGSSCEILDMSVWVWRGEKGLFDSFLLTGL